MKILGINPAHDSSIAIINNGQLEKYYKEERFSRHKRDIDPYTALLKVIKEHDNIDHAVICSPSQNDPTTKFLEKLLYKFFNCSTYNYSDQHHLCHASLAFYNSGFEESLVIVIDRNGSEFGPSRESESVYSCSYPNNFKPLYKSFWVENKGMEHDRDNVRLKKELQKQFENCDLFADSTMGIVKIYESATSLIGLHPLENGKTMGLSGYGKNPKTYPAFFKDQYSIDNYFIQDRFVIDHPTVLYKEHIDNLTNNITENNYQFYADYAVTVQEETQEAALQIIKKYVNKTGIKNVCLTGGYALNVLANAYFSKHLPNVNFYFEPNPDDSGISIGGPLHLYRQLTKDTIIKKLDHTFYHSSKHDLSQINGIQFTEKDAAIALSENKSIAIFNGNAEAGPRALGNRSIIFDPRNKDAKDIINKIKKREWYRPFAGSVLKDDAKQYFEMGHLIDSPNMTVAFKVTDPNKIPGITHVDNTCRVQTVDESIPHLYLLLQEFKNCTGCSVLLNTSFNLAGEPLVESVDDALNTFNNSDINILWFPEIKQAYIKK